VHRCPGVILNGAKLAAAPKEIGVPLAVDFFCCLLSVTIVVVLSIRQAGLRR